MSGSDSPGEGATQNTNEEKPQPIDRPLPSINQQNDDSASSQPQTEVNKNPRYWDRRFIVTTVVIALLVLIATYLQYSVWPSIITQFGDTNISIHLSFFTYTLYYNHCFQGSCVLVKGVQSLDFAQIFFAALILIQVFHYFTTRKKNP